MKVNIDSVYIKKSECYGFWDEPGSSAEWKLLITVNGQTIVWESDGIQDNQTYYINRDLYVDIANNNTNIVVQTSGVEKDTSSADDTLPSGSYTHGNADNWGIGATRKVTASSECFDYTVYYTVTCLTTGLSTIDRPTALQATRAWAAVAGVNLPPSDPEVIEFYANRVAKRRGLNLAHYTPQELVFNGAENIRTVTTQLFPTSAPPPTPPPTPGPPPQS